MLSINLHKVNDKSKRKEEFYHQGIIQLPNPNRIIVGKTHRQCRHDLLFFRLVVLFLCHCNGKEIVSDMQVLFFAFCCENWHIRWMNRHPVSFRGGQTFFFMTFHTILGPILNYGFCAISSRVIFFTFFPTIKRMTLQRYFFCFSSKIIRAPKVVEVITVADLQQIVFMFGHNLIGSPVLGSHAHGYSECTFKCGQSFPHLKILRG